MSSRQSGPLSLCRYAMQVKLLKNDYVLCPPDLNSLEIWAGAGSAAPTNSLFDPILLHPLHAP